MHCRTDDGKAFRTLNVLDEFSRECLAIKVARKLNASSVNDALSDLFILRGVPSFIRSDNGPEFVAQAVRDRITAVGASTAYIEPGSPWENGYIESFNARFRDELLNGEVFYSLREAQIIIERWRRHYNTRRPHSALGYRPPAPETIVPMDKRPVMHLHSNRTSQIGLLTAICHGLNRGPDCGRSRHPICQRSYDEETHLSSVWRSACVTIPLSFLAMEGGMVSEKFRLIDDGGIWLALGGALLAVILPVHGPTYADLSVQMQHIADGHGQWAIVHWLAAIALLFMSGAGFIHFVETLIGRRHIAPAGAWLLLALGSFLTIGTAVVEATAISAAASTSDLKSFLTWWPFASGLGNGFMVVALATAMIAYASARTEEPPIAIWLCWAGLIVALLSALGWSLGQHVRVQFGGPLWFVSTLALALWLAWFGFRSRRTET